MRFLDAALAPDPNLVGLLERAKRPTLLTHIYPDGDAIGSELAMARMFSQLGARPRVFNAHMAPLLQEFMDPEGVIEVVGAEPTADQRAWLDDSDLIVVVDTSDLGRLGFLGPFALNAPAPLVVIDHHVTDDVASFAALWSVPESPATGLLILELALQLDLPIDARLAEALFVALATDTGWFRFQNSSGPAFAAAAALVERGADPAYLHGALFEGSSLGRAQMLGEMLTELRARDAGRILHSTVRQEQLARFGIGLEQIDGFIDSLKEVRGAEILILFVEVSVGSYKVSLRSKGGANVQALAARFGGGGHEKAAGFRIRGSDREVTQLVLGAATELLRTDGS